MRYDIENDGVLVKFRWIQDLPTRTLDSQPKYSVEWMRAPREHLASGVVEGIIYVIGGRTTGNVGDSDTNLNVNEAYDPSTDSWSTRQRMPSKRGALVASSTTESIVTFGGEQRTGTFANTEQYFPGNDTWKIREHLPTARHGLGAATIGRDIYVIGGGPSPGLTVTGANERFNVDTLGRPSTLDPLEIRGLLTVLIPVLAVGVAGLAIVLLKKKSKV